MCDHQLFGPMLFFRFAEVPIFVVFSRVIVGNSRSEKEVFDKIHHLFLCFFWAGGGCFWGVWVLESLG